MEDARAGGPGANARSRLSRLVNALRAVSSLKTFPLEPRGLISAEAGL